MFKLWPAQCTEICYNCKILTNDLSYSLKFIFILAQNKQILYRLLRLLIFIAFEV